MPPRQWHPPLSDPPPPDDADAQVDSSPALGADGTVYVGSNDSHLHAVAEAEGTQKWKYATGDEVAETGAEEGSECRGTP